MLNIWWLHLFFSPDCPINLLNFADAHITQAMQKKFISSILNNNALKKKNTHTHILNLLTSFEHCVDSFNLIFYCCLLFYLMYFFHKCLYISSWFIDVRVTWIHCHNCMKCCIHNLWTSFLSVVRGLFWDRMTLFLYIVLMLHDLYILWIFYIYVM